MAAKGTVRGEPLPAWRKADADGALRIHPDDALALGLRQGSRAMCTTETGELEVTIELDKALRPGVTVLPHGVWHAVWRRPADWPAAQPANASEHRDPITKTPFHKHVSVRLRPLSDEPSGAG